MSTDTSRSATAQCAQILAYLKAGYSLTTIDALNMFGCFRLGARVWDLKRDGHNIQTRIIERNGKRFAEYSIPGTDMQLFPEAAAG